MAGRSRKQVDPNAPQTTPEKRKWAAPTREQKLILKSSFAELDTLRLKRDNLELAEQKELEKIYEIAGPGPYELADGKQYTIRSYEGRFVMAKKKESAYSVADLETTNNFRETVEEAARIAQKV